jgi:hypothetical protein
MKEAVQMQSIRSFFARALAVTAMLLLSAGASPATVQDLQPLSAETAFPPNCSTLIYHGVVPDDFEMETTIAVNPSDPRNIVVAWTQGGFFGVVAAVTKDGGQSWTKVVVPGVSGCSGAEQDTGAADPRLAFDRNGIAYLSLDTFPFGRPGTESGASERLTVLRSSDGGLTWPERTVVPAGEPDGFNAEMWITAHPREAARAYLIWTKHNGDFYPTYFSRTDDGETWTRERRIVAAPGERVVDFLHNLQVLPSGALLDVFLRGDYNPPDPLPKKYEVLSIRSEDEGETWSEPSRVAVPQGAQPRDPETHVVIWTHPLSATPFGVAPDGTAYAAWHDIDFPTNGSSRILLAKSTDGGVSWSDPIIVKEERAQAFTPTLAVAEDGTVGVTYYDFRNDKLGDGELTTDFWFAHSGDRGETWEEEHVAGPFDMRRAALSPAPDNEPSFNVIDYYQLATAPGGFVAAFAQAPPNAPEPPNDIFFARLLLGGERARTTGGGWLADSDGDKLNFGFHVRQTASRLDGELRLNDKGGGARIELAEPTYLGPVGEECGSFAAGPSSLELRGRGTYNGAAASFRVCVQDNGEGAGAQADRFYLACTSGCEYSTAEQAPDDLIDGGNIQVARNGENTRSGQCTMILDPLLADVAPAGQLTLTGTVYDAEQEPQASATVELRATAEGGGSETLTAQSDALGRATFATWSVAVATEFRARACDVESNVVELTPLAG